MSRLYDRMFTCRWVHPRWLLETTAPKDLHKLRCNIRDRLKAAHVIVADNVCEYLFAGTDKEDWDATKDFPCIAPPFPSFFIEAIRPSKSISRVHGVQEGTRFPPSTGVLFQAEKLKVIARRAKQPAQAQLMLDTIRRKVEGLSKIYLRSVEAKFARYGNETKEHLSTPELNFVTLIRNLAWIEKNGLPFDTLGDGWSIGAMSFMELPSGEIMGPLGSWNITLDDAGTVTDYAQGIIRGEGDGWLPTEDEIGVFNPGIFVPLLTLSFMNCKNVTVQLEEPPTLLSRKHQKKHGRPLVKFHTLEIKPMQEILRHEGNSEETGIKKALHICRGHFADYSQGRGLFGKYKGRYWWDSHVRGSIEQGAVIKDYNVKTPANVN